ncbi:MAG: transglycosylase SLT domain-containing protein [Dehalococcoidia bacterium]|nr:transglycosylase SLT domain-containing protein [Dehalococcoidia bacterium]
MPTDAIGPSPSAPLTWGDAVAPAAAELPAEAPPPFAEVLQRELARPRDELARVRAEVAAIRDGGPLGARTGSASALAALKAYGSTAGAPPPDASMQAGAFVLPPATGPVSDPYGWRAMARETAEALIGEGYGPLFERQIQQESGFAPDVALGLRVSSAGAEGIAQLMPQYYAGVDRKDPQASLVAGAQTMRHYLQAWDGDVRKALASYNAGLGRVRQAVQAHGDAWERGLPAETRQYLAAIMGPLQATFLPSWDGEVAVFGGRGPGGVLSSPLEGVVDRRTVEQMSELTAPAGSTVRAPSDGVVTSVTQAGGLSTVLLDHGNGWRTTLTGLEALVVSPGDSVRRSQPLGALGGREDTTGAGDGLLRLGVLLDGRPVDAGRYLLA